MAKKGLASALSQAVSAGKQTLDEGQKAGLSDSALRDAVRQAASQQMLAPAQNISNYIANLVASQQAAQQQQISQPVQTVAPGAAPESKNGFAVTEDEESFTSKDDEKKEKKRSPWHERQDEMLGENGLGANLFGLATELNPITFNPEAAGKRLTDMVSDPAGVMKGTLNELLSAGEAPLDILAPEWAFNPASKEEIAEGYAQGPAEFNGDFSMPSGETVANMTPKQREELVNLMGEGLGLSAASALQFLPIGGAIPKIKPTESVGMVVPKSGVKQPSISQAAESLRSPVTRGDISKLAPEQQAELADFMGEGFNLGTAMKEASPTESVKAVQKPLAKAEKRMNADDFEERLSDAAFDAKFDTMFAPQKPIKIGGKKFKKALERAEKNVDNKYTTTVMERALNKIGEDAGKGKGAPMTDIWRNRSVGERFNALPKDVRKDLKAALKTAQKKNKSAVTEADMSRAINAVNRSAMLPSGRYLIPTALGMAGGLGGILGAETMGALDGSGVPANMINNPEVASDISGSTNAIGTTSPSAKTGNDSDGSLADLIGSAAPSTHPQTQYSELLDWALNTDEGQAFMAAYPQYFDADLGYATVDDYLEGSGVGYGRLFSTPDEAAFSWLLGSDGSHAGIDSWRRRYAAQGLDTNDIDAVMDYIYGDNSVNITDLNDPRMMYGNLGDDALANAAILRYLYQNNQFGLNQQWANDYLQSGGYAPGAFDANDFAWYMTLANMAQNNGAGYSVDDIETLAKLAGEGFQFGLVDDTNGFRDESETRRNARKYSLADLMNPNGNLNPYQDILYDSDMLDTAIYFYNQSHPGQKLGIKER